MHGVQSVNIYKSWLGSPVTIGKKKEEELFKNSCQPAQCKFWDVWQRHEEDNFFSPFT